MAKAEPGKPLSNGQAIATMTEDSAKTIYLVKAVETSGAADLWSAEDAEWANQGAAHIVGSEAGAEKFIDCRARLAWDRLLGRRPALRRLQAKSIARPWLGWLLVLFALVGGVLIDHIGPDKRINILAIPVLGLLAWNLLIYLILFGQTVYRLILRRPPKLSRIAGLIAGLSTGPGKALGPDSQSVQFSFWQAWSKASLPLAAARAGRFLHLAAVAFAAGVVASLYFRGILNEYKAGWESTFLDAAQLHWLMTVLFGGFSGLFQISIPDVATLEKMRFPGAPGTDAAPWIHGIAGLTAGIVILPRLLLAALAGWRQAWLERHFPLDLKEPYYQRLLGHFRSEAALVAVIPYSTSISPQIALQIQQIVHRLFGPKADIALAEPVAFGGEDDLPASLLANNATLRMVIFSLAATPEDENHGALLRKIREVAPASSALLVLVDESGFRERFAGQAERLAERRQLWSRFLEGIPVRYLLCDLSDPDISILYRQLDAALSNSGEGA